MKAYTIALLITVLPALASAESYLCVEDQKTGFRFTSQKQWHQSNFSPNRKYLVKPNKGQSMKGKWIVSEIGEPVPHAWSEYDFTSTGALKADGPFGEFAMNRKNLRFVVTYILGYWTDAIPGEDFVEGETTPLISIGKCSLLDP